VHEGGRGPSIWDTFSHTPGKTFNGETGDVADDFYHLFPDDIKLMKELGLRTFRFSVAWSRIFPNGSGQPNEPGIDFYNRLVDALRAAGIQPYCTLYHWDLPQALQDKGGWENRDTAKAFAHYAGFTAGFLSDRVKHFMTMNEMRSFVELGYGQGVHAPGLKLDARRLAQLNHYVVLAHGLSVQAIRAHAKPGTMVGIADKVEATTPIIETPEHIEAARRAMREQNAMFLAVLEEGRYTDLYLRRLGANAPTFTAEEMAIIKSPMDFVGLNIYQPTYVRTDDSEMRGVIARYEVERMPTRHSTARVYRAFLNNHITPRWGDVRIQDVQPRPVDSWLRELSLSPTSKTHVRSLMHGLVEFAMWAGLLDISRNPISLVKNKGAMRKVRKARSLTAEQFQALLTELLKYEVMAPLASSICLP
jgi:beta-glucosidase/6-phospho-beta-glucosidase/beta-galactosidase